jgi:hypothetical protein
VPITLIGLVLLSREGLSLRGFEVDDGPDYPEGEDPAPAEAP